MSKTDIIVVPNNSGGGSFTSRSEVEPNGAFMSGKAGHIAGGSKKHDGSVNKTTFRILMLSSFRRVVAILTDTKQLKARR
jgi:hypothetical protein